MRTPENHPHAAWLSLSLIAACLCTHSLFAADWPHWLGPKRDGASPETGLLTSWPKGGPKVLWKQKGGDGYSSVAVADGRAVTLVQDGEEYAVAFDAEKGDKLWKTKIGPAYKHSFGNGPRATPAIDGGRVYVQSVTGNVACLDAKTGDIVWQKDILALFKAKNIQWGLSASPVVLGDVVIVVPGGAGAEVAALKKDSGEIAWQSGDGDAAYATPQPASAGGKDVVLCFTAKGFWALEPKKGAVLWEIPWKTEFDCNIATPLVVGDKVFVSSGEGNGAALFDLSASGPPEAVWRFKTKTSPLTTYWATAVHHDGHLYGISGEFNKKLDLSCVELKSGKLKWSQPDIGKAALTLADGHLFIATKKGELIVAEANAEKYVEKGRAEGALGKNARTAPTIANGRLYVRDLADVYCLDIRGK